MKIQSITTLVLVSLGFQALALPTVQVGSKETGITSISTHLMSKFHHFKLTIPLANPDGSKSIGGPNGITTNAQGQTTNVGGSGGITIIPSASNTTAEAPKSQPKPKGNSNSTDALTALLGAAQGKNSTGTNITKGGEAVKVNGTASLPPGVQANSTLGGIFGSLMGAGRRKLLK